MSRSEAWSASEPAETCGQVVRVFLNFFQREKNPKNTIFMSHVGAPRSREPRVQFLWGQCRHVEAHMVVTSAKKFSATIQTLPCGTDLTDPLFEPFVCLKIALCLVRCGVGCACSCGPPCCGLCHGVCPCPFVMSHVQAVHVLAKYNGRVGRALPRHPNFDHNQRPQARYQCPLAQVSTQTCVLCGWGLVLICYALVNHPCSVHALARGRFLNRGCG